MGISEDEKREFEVVHEHGLLMQPHTPNKFTHRRKTIRRESGANDWSFMEKTERAVLMLNCDTQRHAQKDGWTF